MRALPPNKSSALSIFSTRQLSRKPLILLLDEPTASLDFRATRHIEELLLELAGAYPMIVVSHSPGQAERLANAVAVFSHAG
jgi:phosphate transport system ATP-binding protein